jgi:hypothetical protein
MTHKTFIAIFAALALSGCVKLDWQEPVARCIEGRQYHTLSFYPNELRITPVVDVEGNPKICEYKPKQKS